MTKVQLFALIAFLLVGYFVQSYFPWYSCLFVAAACAFFSHLKPSKAFGMYFLFGAVLWVCLAAFIDNKSASRLSSKVGLLFGNLNLTTLLIITGLIGGITAGLGALLGSLTRSLINKE